jgi:2-keto-4-pentenoate hydratase
MSTDYSQLAERLRTAYTTGVIAPLRDGLEPTDAAGAYSVQLLNTQYWVAQGRRIVGRKVGLTAKTVQAQFGVNQPDFGVLFDDMAIPDGGRLSPSKLLQPRAEAEVAVVLAKDISDPGVTVETVASCIAQAVAAIEIVDSRIADWKISFADTVADNGSSAYYALGKTFKPLDGLDLWSCGMVLEINGEVRSLGAGAACLGHPLNAVAWLARTLAERGQSLRKGDIILSGALGPMVALTAGDQVRATIGGLGSVEFTYA